MEQAIMQFQQAQRLRTSGRIDRGGLDAGKLEQALPASHRRMAAVPGTAVVFRSSGAGPNVGAAARETERKATLPDIERSALAALQTDAGRLFGLGLAVTAIRVSADGRFRVTLRNPNTVWLDGTTKRFRSDGKIPDAVCEILGQRLGRAWRPAAGQVGSAGWSLVSARGFAALKGAPRPDRRDLAALGITHLPTSQPVQACVAGCIALLDSGRANQGAGQREFEALLSAIRGPAPDTARRLQLAQTAPGQAPRRWVNPTGGGIRGKDPKGEGRFGASRDGGRRTHEGVDYVATPGQVVVAVTSGEVTKFGFTYTGNFTHRYVQITLPNGDFVREFYVAPFPHIRIGTNVTAGQPIGTYQGLSKIHPGITEHVHLEIWRGGQRIDPTPIIP